MLLFLFFGLPTLDNINDSDDDNDGDDDSDDDSYRLSIDFLLFLFRAVRASRAATTFSASASAPAFARDKAITASLKSCERRRRAQVGFELTSTR